MQKDFMKKVLKNGRRIISYILILLIICTMTAVAFPLKASARSDYGFDDNTLCWNNGDNSCNFGSGTNTSWAVSFSPEDLKDYDGRVLKSVSLYDYLDSSVGDYSTKLLLRIYESPDGDSKGNLLAEKDDCAMTCSNQYVEYSLDTPITIDASKGLWIEFHNKGSAYFPATGAKRNPNVTRGDWLFNYDNTWKHASKDCGFDCNWMIKANLIERTVVSFDANGGTGNMSFIEFKAGEEIKLPANSFTYDGKYFAGWATDSEAKTPEYSDEQTITPSGSVKLYAFWKDKESQEISASDMSVMIGETGKSIAASITKGDGNISYSVKSGTSVTIDSLGNISTVDTGDTVITITASGTEKYLDATKDITITVTDKPVQVIEANNITLAEGESAKLEAKLTTGNGILSYLVTGGDTDSISFDETTGDITALKSGSAVITVKSSETAEYAAATISVNITVTPKKKEENNTEDDVTEEVTEEVTEDVTEEVIVEQKDFLDPLRTELSIAADLAKNTNQHQVVNYQADYSALPYEFMKLLQDNPQITLNLTFPFEGEMVTVTISGDKVVADSTIPWYGPAYMMGRFSGSGNANAANTGVYIVKKGDTLSDIAYLFGTTVEALVEKNGIKNRDLIYIGQEIKY